MGPLDKDLLEKIIDKICETNPGILGDEAERIARDYLEIQQEYNLLSLT